MDPRSLDALQPMHDAGAMDRSALADFLTRHRETLQPADVGLAAGPRRRVTGLRRDEVAALAAISTDYYSRLEQQRGPQPSTQTLGALARALRLTGDERDYLYRVAGHSAPDQITATEHVAPALQRVLDRLTDTPALVLTPTGETLVQNDLARALLGDASAYTGLERSSIYRWFVSPEQEQWRYPEDDRERQGRAQVSSLRAAYGLMGADSRAGAMVRELTRRSEQFARFWSDHEVWRRFEDHKVLIHPEAGPIELDCQALFTEDQSQALLVLTAAPRSEAESQLKLLGVVGMQQFADGR